MKYFVIFLVLVGLSGTAFADEIEIKFGETVLYEDLNLYFYDIEDSRCPLDVTCIWEGKVSARINTSNQTHKIGGNFEIGYSLTYMTPYTITLIDVKPHPISTEKPEYFAILDISKIEQEPYIDPDNLCPTGKVFDFDICVDKCPTGQIANNGVCQHAVPDILDIFANKVFLTFFITLFVIILIGFIIWRKRNDHN